MVLPRAPLRRRLIADAAFEMAPLSRRAWEGFDEPTADLRERAARLAIPVLVAWARSDLILSLRGSRPAIQRIPHHWLEEFNGGHAAFLEAPDAFAASLSRFIDRLGDVG